MSATGRASGFTLIETLVVLGILGLVSGLAFPRLQAMSRAAEYRTSVAAAAALLRDARAAAQRTGLATRVRLAEDGATLLAGSTAHAFPATVRASVEPETGIVFAPDGTATRGSLRVAADRRAVRFVVAPLTGLAAPA